jgi:hypothetical protein
MTMLESPSRERPPRPRRGRPAKRRRELIARVVLATLVLVLAFLLGMAVAQTLDERPEPGGVVTDVRTLSPMEQQAPARTVTVTVTTP